jgi:hypothetical protein
LEVKFRLRITAAFRCLDRTASVSSTVLVDPLTILTSEVGGDGVQLPTDAPIDAVIYGGARYLRTPGSFRATPEGKERKAAKLDSAVSVSATAFPAVIFTFHATEGAVGGSCQFPAKKSDLLSTTDRMTLGLTPPGQRRLLFRFRSAD